MPNTTPWREIRNNTVIKRNPSASEAQWRRWAIQIEMVWPGFGTSRVRDLIWLLAARGWAGLLPQHGQYDAIHRALVKLEKDGHVMRIQGARPTLWTPTDLGKDFAREFLIDNPHITPSAYRKEVLGQITVLVCGSREWNDYETIQARLSELAERYCDVTLIHGAAYRGADRIGEIVGKAMGFKVMPFPAHWQVSDVTDPRHIRTRPDGSTYDSFAGKRRNIEMLDYGPDLVIAFQKNRSSGTQHTIDEAKAREIPLEVFR